MMKPFFSLTGKLILIFVTILLQQVACCQNKARLDSLNYRLGTADNDTTKVNIYLELAREYSQLDLSMAMQYAESALEIAEKSDNSNVLANALFNIGYVYYSQGRFEMAIKQYYRCLEIQKSKGDKVGMAYTQMSLGAVNMNLKNYKQAKECCEEVLTMFEKLQQTSARKPYSNEIITTYNNLGLVTKELGERVKAIDYYSRGLSLARRTPGNEYVLAMLLNNLGSLYLEMGKYNEAYNAINEALDIRLKLGDKTGQANTYRTLAEYYTKIGNTTEALKYLYMGYTLSEQIGSISLQSKLSEMLFEAFRKSGKADSALKYHILLKQLNDTLNLVETQKELTRLELTSNFNEKEKLRQIEIKRKEFRYLVTGIAMVLILAIVSLLYLLSQNRVKRLNLEKDNTKLISKNLELEKIALEQELELRNKELATNVMFQIQKNELIQEIIDKLLTHNKKYRNEDFEVINGIIRTLEKTQDKTVWNEFEVRFNQVHNEFYEKLNNLNPDLSPNERRLCAFLRLNMTTKEIASITGQSIRSIEVARTRMRSKLNLTNSETGLIEYLSSL